MKDNIVSIKNRKASYDYFFLRELVVGIELRGSEVKQIRKGKVSLVDSFCTIEGGELFARGVNIAATEEAFSHEPLRPKRLLAKKAEILKWQKEMEEGVTIVVKKIFTGERGLLKMEIALARGKKNYDKRASIKDKESKKEIQQYI